MFEYQYLNRFLTFEETWVRFEIRQVAATISDRTKQARSGFTTIYFLLRHESGRSRTELSEAMKNGSSVITFAAN